MQQRLESHKQHGLELRVPLDHTGAIFTPLHVWTWQTVLVWSCVSCLCGYMIKAFREVWDLINSSIPFLRNLWLRIWQWRWLIWSGVTLQLTSTPLCHRRWFQWACYCLNSWYVGIAVMLSYLQGFHGHEKPGNCRELPWKSQWN